MAENYSVRAVLSATDNGFSSTLKNALNTTESLASKIKSGFAFGILQGVGQQAFSTIRNSARELISEIDSSNASWKNFTSNLQMLGKSDKEIAGIKKELQEFAEQTVYSSSDMATTFAQLEAVGTKNTTKLVKGFGGLAAAAENPQQAMKTLSTQATQMAAKPTVAWADFKLMLEQTPAGLAAVAKEMGMTTSELVKSVQDGEVATEDFFDAIQKVGTSKSFTKLATEYKTVGQAMDGLKESIANKLTPAWDVLSQAGISAVGKLSDALGGIDAGVVADKVAAALDKAKQYWDALTTAFDGTGTEIMEAFNAVKNGLTGFSGALGDATDVESFSSAMETVAGGIKIVADFVEKHGETIGKALPWVAGLVIAFKGLSVVNSVVPGMSAFTSAIGSMVSSGISSLAGKLFGVAGGTKASGEAAATSATQMVAGAKAFMMIGIGVLMIAAGFALLAQSAIALSNAGGLAIGVMAGLVIALAALSIGMLVLMKTMEASPAQLGKMALAMLSVGAAILMVGVGFALLAQSAIALSGAGWGAIGVMIGMVVVIALLAVGAVVLGAAAASASTGLLILAAVILAIGVSTVIAAAALAIVSAVLPKICQYGLEGAGAITALAGAMLVFSVGASAAGVAATILGAGLSILATSLTVIAVAVVMIAAGMLAIAVSAMLVASSMALVANALPLIVQHSNGATEALAILSLGLIAFGAGALVAGAGCAVLGVGLAAVGVAVTILASGILLLAAGCLIAAAALALISLVLPTITAYGKAGAEGILALSAAMLVFGVAAGVAGAGCTVLGVGLAVIAVGLAAVGVAITVIAAGVTALAVGALVAAASLAVLALILPSLIKNGAEGAAAIITLSGALLTFGGGATVAGAGCLILAAGLISAAASAGAFGASMILSAAGVLVMLAAVKALSSSMKTIAKNAKSAENSLDDMQNSVDLVESGLSALGDKAKSAMNKLKSAFDSTASKVQSSGKKLGEGFTKGMQTGLAKAPAAATQTVVVVNVALLAGQAGAYKAGAYFGKGFANGMLSQMAVIERAAARMAAAADKAVQAKLKIHSPSKVGEDSAYYYAISYVKTFKAMASKVWDAAEELVTIPQIATPDLAFAYGGELSEDYRYYRSADYTIEVPLSVDGKEFARATASYTQDELDKRQLRDSRKHGKA